MTAKLTFLFTSYGQGIDSNKKKELMPCITKHDFQIGVLSSLVFSLQSSNSYFVPIEKFVFAIFLITCQNTDQDTDTGIHFMLIPICICMDEIKWREEGTTETSVSQKDIYIEKQFYELVKKG